MADDDIMGKFIAKSMDRMQLLKICRLQNRTLKMSLRRHEDLLDHVLMYGNAVEAAFPNLLAYDENHLSQEQIMLRYFVTFCNSLKKLKDEKED